MSESWQERAAKERKWNITPLGKAFRKFENAHSRFWQMDGQNRIADHALRSADEAQQTARREFLMLLRGW
jgi:hypothetical protein